MSKVPLYAIHAPEAGSQEALDARAVRTWTGPPRVKGLKSERLNVLYRRSPE